MRTRSCNNGFFSSSGSFGNCCVSASCNFITACRSSYVFYAAGSSVFCGSTGKCGTGIVLQTIGDLSPLSVFNCESDWRVTATITTSTSTSLAGPSTVTSVRTAATTATVTTSATARGAAISLGPSSTAQVTSASASASELLASPVTLTVTSMFMLRLPHPLSILISFRLRRPTNHSSHSHCSGRLRNLLKLVKYRNSQPTPQQLQLQQHRRNRRRYRGRYRNHRSNRSRNLLPPSSQVKQNSSCTTNQRSLILCSNSRRSASQ